MAKLISTIFPFSHPLFIIISLLLLSPLPLTYSKQNVTNIRLYLQDQFNASQPIEYGDVFAFQDPLTAGPNPNSLLLGRAQGTTAFTTRGSLTDIDVSIAYIFTSGRYNGSTVVAVGKNDMSQSVHEFPIIGGTGAFKLARGIVTGSTYSEIPPIFIYDIEIILDN